MSTYQLLEQNSNDEFSDKHFEQGGDRCPHCQHQLSISFFAQSRCSRWSLWTLLACLLLTFLNCLLLLASSELPNQCIHPIMQVTTENLHELRRPTPFIGFDDIQRPVPPVHRELINFPGVIQQIDKKRRDFVFDDDPLAYMSDEGFVSPESRRVLVTKEVSTLVQFRVIDYGMEECELHIDFPFNTTIPQTSNPFLISINRMEGRIPLNTRTLSYNTRPRQSSSIVQLRINPYEGEQEIHWWQKFACKWDELLLFELACYEEGRLGGQEGNCRIEWWQDKKEDELTPSVYLKQYSTV